MPILRAESPREAVSRDAGKVSSWAVAKETWKAEGTKGFYHGGVVTGVRDAVGYAFYFWSYEISKRLVANPTEDTQRQAALKVLLCGGIAGIVTWASIFPLDVIKTRVQTQHAGLLPSVPRPATGQVIADIRPSPERAYLLPRPSSPSSSTSQTTVMEKRLGAWQMTKHLYRTEGLPVFFRGLGICSVRAFIVNAVQWAVYEWMMQLMMGKKQP